MKKHFSAKFLLAAAGFLLLILSFVLMAASLRQSHSKPSVPVFNRVRIIVNPAMTILEKNYSIVSQPGDFKALIEPTLEDSRLELQIIDIESNLIFDSTRDTDAYKPLKANLERAVHFDMAFMEERPGYVTYAFPVVVDEVQKANAVFTMPAGTLDNASGDVSSGFFLLSLFVFLTGIFLLLAVFRSLHHHYVKPVKSLGKAIPQLIKGNLDMSLESGETNEMGEFTRALDLMRIELKDTLERKNRLESERKELVASLSHEIKTPLSSVKAYAEGLRDGLARDPEAIKQYAGVILSKTDGLVKLVNDLLDHSLQELGCLTVTLREHYSRNLMTGILDPLRLKFLSSNISLEIEREIPDVLIRADALRIEQVLVNLIQNAEKYAPEGGKIKVGAVVEDDCLLVSVSDNGCGIPPEELPFVFERHWRGKKAAESRIEGAGLGLSICKYIVERHGGTIFAESTPGAGSHFRFTIPKI